MVTTEDLLALALVAVYLWDSMHFLRVGEAVVETRGRTLRGISFGVSFELGGRRPYLPNPFTPFWPACRIEWDTSGGPVADPRAAADEMCAQLEALRPLRWVTIGCALLIAIVAPVSLALGLQVYFLASVAGSLLFALIGCLIVIVRRRRLGLRIGQLASVVFVALICLPCAPNLARAVAGQRRWTLAARDLPELGFDARSAVRAQILEALTSARRYVAEESVEYKVIDEQQRLLEGGPP
jgi:hypothetical protein